MGTKFQGYSNKGGNAYKVHTIGEAKPGGTDSGNFKKISPQELQYRRNNNLCYRCGEKFTAGHQCKLKHYTFMVVDKEDSPETIESSSLLDAETDELDRVMDVACTP